MATSMRNVRISKLILQVLNSWKDGNLALVRCRQTSMFWSKRVLSTATSDNQPETSKGRQGSSPGSLVVIRYAGKAERLFIAVTEKLYFKDGQDVKCEQTDPLPLFCSERVQSLLHRITGFDINKINRMRHAASVPPEYHLLTEEQLKQKKEEAEAEAHERLQMPPYMKTREPITEVLSRDSSIQGVHQHKFVFTDITYAMPDRVRQVVVRDPDGTLRKATWEERDKVNQIYNPQPGRKLFVPKMFSPENLENLLAQRKYEYVLDRACVQFEPDNAEYIRVTRRTYEVVNSQQDFEDLRSTRHFGPMAFYLAWHKNIDHLLVDMLKRDKLSDAADLVHLFHEVHPDCKSAQASKALKDPLHLIDLYCQRDAVERGRVELALQSYYSDLQTEKAA